MMHLKFITGNFIIGSRLLCFNGSVDKSLPADDNRLSPFPFPWPQSRLCLFTRSLRSLGRIKELAVMCSWS